MNVFYSIVIYDLDQDKIDRECEYPNIETIEEAIELAEFQEMFLDLTRYSVEIAEYNIDTVQINYINAR